jgi:rhodanese-related sulfurtransferase
MSHKTLCAICVVILMCASAEERKLTGRPHLTQDSSGQAQPASAEVVTVEQLKAKLAKGEPITIIDVRGTEDFNSSPSMIKGAVRVKLRRLRYRLGFPPLKEVPRDREVVTYCACPNDEASVLAAQILSAASFKRPLVLKGGWQAWLNAKGPVEAKGRGL